MLAAIRIFAGILTLFTFCLVPFNNSKVARYIRKHKWIQIFLTISMFVSVLSALINWH